MDFTLAHILSSSVSLGSISYKYFKSKRDLIAHENSNVQFFVNQLSTKDVFVANIHSEVLPAVIKSLEDVILEIDTLVSKVSHEELELILKNFKLALKVEISGMYVLDPNEPKYLIKFFKHLQKSRKEAAVVLAFLCGAFEISINDSNFKNFLIIYGISPR